MGGMTAFCIDGKKSSRENNLCLKERKRSIRLRQRRWNLVHEQKAWTLSGVWIVCPWKWKRRQKV